jgi:hypothetical protein
MTTRPTRYDRALVRAQLDLARAKAAIGCRAESRRVLESLAAWSEELLGSDDDLTLRVTAALVSARSDTARLDTGVVPEYAADAQRVLARCEEHFGLFHPVSLEVLAALGRLCCALGRSTEAVSHFERLVGACTRAFGEDDERSVRATRLLADALGVARQGDEAPAPVDLLVQSASVSQDPEARWAWASCYEGPYVAAKGSWPRPWVFVADGEAPGPDAHGRSRSLGPRGASTLRMTPPAARTTQEQTGAVAPADAGPSAASSPTSGPQGPTQGVTNEAGGPGPIALRVLGAVEVTGWAIPPERAIVTEIVCYLALADGPVRAEDLRRALRPDPARPIAPETFRTYLSYVRKAVGPERFPPAGSGGYRIVGVTTDWDRFCDLVARENTDALNDALGLVRGRPFTGAAPGTYGWAEGIAARMEAHVTSATVRLGRLEIERSDRACVPGDRPPIEVARPGVPSTKSHTSEHRRKAPMAGAYEDQEEMEDR